MALDDYIRETWSPQMPITADRMNNIEKGVLDNRNAIKTNTSDIESTDASITAIQTEIGSRNASRYGDKSIWAAIEQVDSAHDLGTLTNDINKGVLAWEQVSPLLTFNANQEIVENLSSVISNIISTESTDITSIKDALGKKSVNNVLVDEFNSFNTVASNIKAIKDTLGFDASTNKYYYSSTNTVYNDITATKKMITNAAGTYTTLQARIEAVETTANNASGAISNVESQINGARVQTGTDPTTHEPIYQYNSLDARFDAAESRLDSIDDADNGLLTNVAAEVKEAHLTTHNDETNEDEEGTLDSRFDAIDGGVTPTRTLNSIVKEVGDAHNVTEGSTLNLRFNNHNTRITGLETEVEGAWRDLGIDEQTNQEIQDSLGQRLDDIDGGVVSTKTLPELIQEITDAYTSTAIQTEIPAEEEGQEPTYTDTVYDSLDARLEAIETAALAAKSDINTIATELDMVDSNGLKTIGTRVDNLAADVSTFASELAMTRDQNGALIDTNTRIDAITNEIAAAHKQTGTENDVPVYDYNTLDERFSANESAINGLSGQLGTLNSQVNHETTGLAATKQIADNTAQALSRLSETVGELVSAGGTATVIVPENKITYNDNKPTIYTDSNKQTVDETISETKDYLLQKGNDYYYWKYLGTYPNGTWKLISGGGGSGTSTAIILSALPNANEANLNADYFIGSTSGEYIHYRYIHNNITNTNEPIIISNYNDVAKDNIKRYNLDLRQGTDPQDNTKTVNYLDVYEYDYGVDNSVLDAEATGVNIINSIALPEGMGGTAVSGGACKVIQIGDTIRTISAAEMQNVLLTFFYQAYEEDDGNRTWQKANYSLYRNDVLIDSGSFKGNQAARDVDPNAPWHTTEENGETVILDYIKDNPSYWVNIDVTQYCDINTTNNFKLVITSENNIQRTRYWDIEVVSLELRTRDFNSNTIRNADTNLDIGLTLIGANKTRYLKAIVDNDTEHPITKETNETSSSITIPASYLDVGAHKIEIKFGQAIGADETLSYSDVLSLDIICHDEQNDDTIILASDYRNINANNVDIETEQYKIIDIPYNLYVPNNEQVIIEYTNTISNLTTSETLTTGSHNYRFRVGGYTATGAMDTATIRCIVNNEIVASITINLFVIKSPYEIAATTDSLVFDFNPEGYTNNTSTEQDRLWVDKNNSNIKLTTNENFDWVHGGWGYDSKEDAPYFCIKAGSRATINYSLFERAPLQSNPNTNTDNAGSFKCIFKVANVSNPEAVFLTSTDNSPSTIINYSSDKLNSKQSLGDLDVKTLFSTYLNVDEYHLIPYNTAKNKLVRDDTVVAFSIINLDDIEVLESTINTMKAEAESAAFEQNIAVEIEDIFTQINDSGEYKTALEELITNEKLRVLADATTVYNTIKTSEDWAAFRETQQYTNIAMDLKSLVEKKLVLEFNHWEVVNSSNFTSQSFINNTKFAAYTDTINHKEVRNIITAPNDNAEQPTVQIDIEYTTGANNTKIYGKILAIRTIDSVLEQGRGLEMRAHRSNLYLNNGILTYPYAEEDIIEYEYNIHTLGAGENKYTSYILAYEDGVPSASILYPVKTNALKQTSPGALTIGSDECDVYIYRMKFYNKELSNKDILQNFCADALNSDDIIDRYANNIETYRSPETGSIAEDPDSISPISIAKACPDLRVIMIEAPSFTTSKNNYVKNTTIRCIKTGIKEGRDPAEDNWIVYNAYHAGQGTSSDAYGAAGRNIDIIFAFNGTDEVIPPKAKNTYRFDKNYKSVLVKGIPVESSAGSITPYANYLNTVINQNHINTEDTAAYNAFMANDKLEGDTITIEQNGSGKISLSDTSVPNNWFNIKLNIASSENANNALLQKRFDRYLSDSYKDLIPARHRDPYVKNDMEFFNTIVFIRETDTQQSNGNYIKHSEFNDTNWHFYGIGNIGDSKKTDATRANIPDDPYEFCVEISDNGLTNSGFASGVWYSGQDANGNGTGAQFTESNYGIKYPVSSEEWNSENNNVRKTLQVYEEEEGWGKSFEFRYDPNTKDGSIVTTDPAEVAAIELFQKNNRKVFADMYEWVVTTTNFSNELSDWFIEESPLYWYLFTERYTMIDSRAKNTFYHYGKIYISDDEYELISDGNDGLTTQAIVNIQSAITTLQANIPNLSGNEKIEAEWQLQQKKAQLKNAQYIMAHRDWFTHDNEQASLHDGYRFDLWDYDNDTALGINNNGKMVFDAGIEDIDKKNGVWIYNEAESVFWARIRNETYTKLVALYNTLKNECFNAEHLIAEFDKWQAQFPENLWRMDFERKYRRPYENGGEVTYLRDMANGRKKYQRREFERNMSVYIHSKYDTTGNYSANDELSFRPVDRGYQINDMAAPGAIGESQIMTIIPYSDIYINMNVGNTVSNTTVGSVHKRAKAGQPYNFNLKEMVDKLQNIQCRIYNASRIQELQGLEHYYPDDLKIAAAKKLKKITVGTDYVTNASGAYILDNDGNRIPYVNDQTTVIELGTSVDANPILETLDIRNCTNLATTFNLQGCINLKNVYAYGTPITEFIFAKNGLLTNLYLPTTISTLTFDNLHLLSKITTLTFEQELMATPPTVSYPNLSTYVSIESSNVSNSKDIVSIALNTLTTIDLDRINWSITNLSDFEPFNARKNILDTKVYDQYDEYLGTTGIFNLAGTVTVLDHWSEVEKTAYTTLWNNKVTFDTSAALHKDAKTKVIYIESAYDSDTGRVEESIIETRFINGGDPIPDLFTADTPLTDLRKRNPTIAEIFQFGDIIQNKYRPYSGWTRSQVQTESTRTLYDEGYRMIEDYYLTASTAQSEEVRLYTYYRSTPHKYTVEWRLDSDKLVKSETNQSWGGGYDLEAPTIQDIRNKGFDTVEFIPIDSNTYKYKTFKQWSKLPTNISPSLAEANTSIYVINAEWDEQIISIDENDENGIFNNVNNITVEQLAMLSRMNNTERNKHPNSKHIVAQKKLNYRMGYDGRDNSGILLADDTSNTRPVRIFNDDNPSTFVNVGTQSNPQYITPFANNNGFTLVLDYQFDETQTEAGSAAVLVGCYAKDSANTSVTGFALYNNFNTNLGSKGVEVGYGNMFDSGSQHYVRVGGNAFKRNIIVIRRPKENPSQLIIYSSKAYSNSDDLDENIQAQTITLGASTINADARLCFGGLKADLTSTYINNHPEYSEEYSSLIRAFGTIFWAKYWPEDLGAGECKELAAWPHENMTAIIADVNATSTEGLRPSIYLTTLTGSNHYAITPAKFAVGSSNNTIIEGWNNSQAKVLCDKRVFNGLPHNLQILINRSSVGYMNYRSEEVYNYTIEAYEQKTYLDTAKGATTTVNNAEIPGEYVYIPSVSSLQADTNYSNESIYERNGTAASTNPNMNLTPYEWIAAAGGLMTVYNNYLPTNNPKWSIADADFSYLNIRFVDKPLVFSVSNKMRVFIVRQQDVENPNRSFKSIIDTFENGLQENDIVIYDNAAYMYVTSNSINKYGLKTQPQDDITSQFNTDNVGGWIKSIPYMTRSVSIQSNQSNFIFVTPTGTIKTPTSSSTQPGMVNLNYSFTI